MRNLLFPLLLLVSLGCAGLISSVQDEQKKVAGNFWDDFLPVPNPDLFDKEK